MGPIDDALRICARIAPSRPIDPLQGSRGATAFLQRMTQHLSWRWLLAPEVSLDLCAWVAPVLLAAPPAVLEGRHPRSRDGMQTT